VDLQVQVRFDAVFLPPFSSLVLVHHSPPFYLLLAYSRSESWERTKDVVVGVGVDLTWLPFLAGEECVVHVSFFWWVVTCWLDPAMWASVFFSKFVIWAGRFWCWSLLYEFLISVSHWDGLIDWKCVCFVKLKQTDLSFNWIVVFVWNRYFLSASCHHLNGPYKCVCSPIEKQTAAR
jgi:hypothetical protein